MLNSRYECFIQSAFFYKVKMAVVLFSMDIQPFFFSQIDSEMVKERDSEVIAGLAWTGWIETES